MGSDPELLNNDIRDSTDFGAARAQAADNLADPRGMLDGRVLLRRVALAAWCAGKSQPVAELRLPGVTKRVPEPFGPALARASHIC